MFRFLLGLIRRHPRLLLLSSLLALLLLLLPFAIQWGLEKTLLAQGVDRVEIEDVDFNPFTGKLRLTQLAAYQKQAPVLAFERAEIDIQWHALWQKHLLLETLSLKNGHLQIQEQAKTLSVAGIPIPLSAKQAQTGVTEKKPPLLAGVDRLNIDNVKLEWLRPGQAIDQTAYTLDQLSLSELYMWNPAPARLKIDSLLNHSRIRTHFQLHLFSEQPKIVGTLKVDRLQLSQLPYLAEQADWETKGTLSTDLTFTAQLTGQGLLYQQQGTINLNGTDIQNPDYQAAANKVDWNGSLHIQETAEQNLVALQGTLQTHDLKLAHPDLTLDLPESRWKGTVRIDQANSLNLRATGDLTLDRAALSHPASNSDLRQTLQAGIDLNLAQSAKGLQLTQNGTLQLTDLSARQAPYRLSLDTLDWRGNLRFAQANRESEPEIEHRGLIQLDQLTINGPEDVPHLMDLQQLKVADLTLNQLESIEIRQLQLDSLALIRHQNQPAFSMENLALDHAKLNDLSELSLGEIRLAGGQSELTLTESNELQPFQQTLDSLNDATPVSEETKPAVTVAKPEPEKRPFGIRWQGIELVSPHSMTLASHQFAEPILKQVLVEQLKLGAADNRTPDANSDYQLQLRVDEFGEVTSQGQLQPFNPRLTATLSSAIKGLNLTGFSPAIKSLIGYEIQSGELSAEMETRIQSGQLKAENTIELKQLELISANNAQTQDFEKSLDMPLDAALSLLRDKQGNIELELPIDGDLTNPQFQLGDVINTALSGAMKKASKSYLLLALQPYGAIALAGEFLKGQIETVRLQPIEFSAGDAVLTRNMQTYMQKVQKLLAEKSKLDLKACPLANEADRNALLKQLARTVTAPPAQTDSSRTAPQPKIREELVNNSTLLELAQKRGDAIKRYLIEQGAESKRIILCKPALSKETTPPRVEIGF